MNYELTKKAMLRLGKLLVSKYKERIMQDDTYATGKLHDSFKYNVYGDLILNLDVLAAKYASVIDKGRKAGRRPPGSRSIIEWMRAKNIKPYSGTKASDYKKAAKSIADAISVNGSIARFNNSGTNFIKEVAKQYQGEGIVEVLNAYRKDIETEINKTVYK